ncbi:MAG: DUF2092 domain-containing protein [Alphaproteobacteria bacterium]
MRKLSRLSVRSLLLTAAFTFALGAPLAAAQEEEPPAKPPQSEEPEPEGKPAPEEPEPAPAKEPEEEPEAEPAPEPETPPAEEPAEEKPAEPAPEKAAPPPEEEPAEKAPPEEEAVSPREAAINAVVLMSKRLAKLDSFSVRAGLAWEQVLDNGEKILALEQVRADVSRPRGLRMERISPTRERVLFYNGEQAVLWGPVTRYYATAPFEGTLAELATHLAEQYGYEIPLADLFLWGHDKAQIEAIEQANWISQDLIGGRICDHYAFRQDGVDWQLWIDTDKSGLPCAYAITDLSDPARPLFLTTIEIDPDADFNDRRFTFDPPEDAAEIPLATVRPRKEKAPAAPEEKAAPEDDGVPREKEPSEGAEEDKDAPENGKVQDRPGKIRPPIE